MSVKAATLDADAESFEFNVPFGAHGVCSMSISSTITITWTMRVDGGSNAVPVYKSDGNAAAYTASDVLFATAPGTYIATASGTSGGSCNLEALSGHVG